jgi:hypothetical protein
VITGQRNQVCAETIAPEWHFENYFLPSQVLPIDDEEVILRPLANTVLILGKFTELGDIFSGKHFWLGCWLNVIAVCRPESAEYDP